MYIYGERYVCVRVQGAMIQRPNMENSHFRTQKCSDGMEDILSLILHGCELARSIESNLSQIAAEPHFLLSSSREVVSVFTDAVNRLNSQSFRSPYNSNLVFASVSLVSTPAAAAVSAQFGKTTGDNSPTGDGGDGYLHVMDLLHGRTMDEDHNPFFPRGLPKTKVGNMLGQLPNPVLEVPAVAASTVIEFGGGSSGGDSSDLVMGKGLFGGLGEVSARGVAEVVRRQAGSSVHRSTRKRKESEGMHTERIPALRTGNLEIPPDDGYTWRKYGQKDILGSRFPRSYYRCTHKNYGCVAKKQVQRLDDDPYTYEVTFSGEHTCQTSTTPLVLPVIPATNPPMPPSSSSPPQATEGQFPPCSLSLSTSIQLGRNWLSREMEAWDITNGHDGGGLISSNDVGESSRAAMGSSHGHRGRELECPVADLADVMFNSCSSGSSMDDIFYSA